MSRWVSTWGQAHTDIRFFSPSYGNRTMRLSIRNCIEGEALRIRVSNREGKKPYRIAEAAIQIEGGRQEKIRFEGKESREVKPGEECYSDTVSMSVRPGELLVVSMAFDGPVISGNGIAECVQCSKKGNYVQEAQFATQHRSKTACYHDMLQAIPGLSSIEIQTESDSAHSIVCFGDSITQQSHWTRPLMEEALKRRPGQVAVINKGIGGNRLLNGPFMSVMSMFGRSGMERFDRDVLGEAGVGAVIFALGTNDIGMARNPKKPDWITAEMLEQALGELVRKCREKKITTYGTTILPRTGSTGYLKAGEEERIKFNEWVRSTDLFDGCIDFDQVVRDAQHPEMLAFSCDSGDHLHPGFLGGERMAQTAAEALLKG